MKQIAFTIALLAATQAVAEDVYVNGYTRHDGVYVAPHHRSAPDGNPYNNYNALGNPYTGQPGHLPQPVSPPPYNVWQR